MVTDRIVHEDHYQATPTIRLAERLDTPLLGALAGVLLFAAGWWLRGQFALVYDYHQLAWLVPLATLLVAWGNRR